MQLIGTALGGAASGAILWCIANGLTAGAAARFVRDLGWPVSSYWLACAVVVVISMLSRIREKRVELRLSTENERTAAELGFTYSPTVERPPIALPCFENWHTGKHGIAAEIDGVPVSVFDLTERIDTGEGDSFPTKTIVLLPADGLPEFTSSRRWAKRFAHIFGFGGMTFDSANAPLEVRDTVRKFVRTIRIDLPGNPGPWVEATSETKLAEVAVHRLITPSVMETLCGFPEWSFQFGAGWMACWRGQSVWSVSERIPRVAIVGAVRNCMLNAAASPSPLVVPARKLPNGAQLLARALGTFAGVSIGLFGTFFLSFAGLMESFGHANYAGAKLAASFLLTAIGVIAFGFLGYIVGAMIGKLPSVARWTPHPNITPEQKAKKDRRDAWQRGLGCVGFFVGGAVGVAMLIALEQLAWSQSQNSFLRLGLTPILPIGGAIVGLIGCLILARRLNH